MTITTVSLSIRKVAGLVLATMSIISINLPENINSRPIALERRNVSPFTITTTVAGTTEVALPTNTFIGTTTGLGITELALPTESLTEATEVVHNTEFALPTESFGDTPAEGNAVQEIPLNGEFSGTTALDGTAGSTLQNGGVETGNVANLSLLNELQGVVNRLAAMVGGPTLPGQVIPIHVPAEQPGSAVITEPNQAIVPEQNVPGQTISGPEIVPGQNQAIVARLEGPGQVVTGVAIGSDPLVDSLQILG